MKAAKKVVSKKAAPAAKVTTPMTISVGARLAPPKTTTVLGIDFEAGDAMKFGKCIRPTQPNRVWTFLQPNDTDIIMWSRHPDGVMDVSKSTVAQFPRYYQIVDFDTPVAQVAGLQNGLLDPMGYEDEMPF